MKDYYDTLGVDKNAGKKEIKQAYRKSVKKLHPDTGNVDDDSKRFRDVTEAYHTLSDEGKRQEYDRIAAASRLDSCHTRVEPLRPAQPVFTRRTRSDPSWDIMEDEIRPQGTARREPLSVVSCLIRLSPSEAQNDVACPLTLKILGPCPSCMSSSGRHLFYCERCHNAGVVSRIKELVINIPGGVENGTVVELGLDHVGLPDTVLDLEVQIA